MATRKQGASRASAGDTVDAFIAALDHPHIAEIEAVRRIILAADPSIGEGIKWNAPSFHTTEYFATMHLRAKQGVQVILHLGAKARKDLDSMEIADPAGMLEWLGKDRATVKFADMNDIRARRDAFQALLREWIAYV